MEDKGADLSHVKLAKSVLVCLPILTGPPQADNIFHSHYGGQYISKRNSVVDCALSSADTRLRLSEYAKVTKAEKDVFSRFKSALGLSHEPTEEEKSRKLKENAEAEEAEHQARLQRIKSAEQEEDSEEGRRRVRREILYGRKR